MGPPSSGGIALVQMLDGADKLNVYKYEHSNDPADIMYPASTRIC